MRLLKFCSFLILSGLLLLAGLAGLYLWPLDLNEDALAHIKTGDLIFQSHTDRQAIAVALASGSRYSHVGIIHRRPDGGINVLDSAGSVGEQPLADWVKYGHGRRFAVYRDTRLTDAQREELLRAAAPHWGKGYDFIFWFDNETLYCSELPYLMYKGIGLPVGRVQTIGELNVDNMFVRNLIEERWQMHPRCQGEGFTYESCTELVMAQPLVTPASLAEDPNMQPIYSNYPF